MKKLVLIIVAIVLIACGNSETSRKQLKLSDGKAGEMDTEAVKESESEEVLHVTFKIEELIAKESTVDAHIKEIWGSAKSEAEKKNIDEGLIKYVYLVDFDEEHNKPIYKIILYETTKIENGNWKIKQVSE